MATDKTVRISSDVSDEIIGRIFLQSKLLMPDGDYPEPRRFADIIQDVVHKLYAMHYHKTNYTKIERTYIKDLGNSTQEPFPMTGDMSFEFEAFLFQTKSALDMTVKVLDVLFPRHFRVHTFESKGDKLIKNLEQFKRKSLFRKGEKILKDTTQLIELKENRNNTIDSIVGMLRNEKAAWLEKAINMRDIFAHYNVIKGSNFKVDKKEQGDVIIMLPLMNGLYPPAFMEAVFKNCLEFIQDLLCLVIELWLPSKFQLCKADVANASIEAWGKAEPDLTKYIKFTLRGR